MLGRADAREQRVLLLYDAARRHSVSRLIAGNVHPRCTTYAYRDADDLLPFHRRASLRPAGDAEYVHEPDRVSADPLTVRITRIHPEARSARISDR